MPRRWSAVCKLTGARKDSSTREGHPLPQSCVGPTPAKTLDPCWLIGPSDSITTGTNSCVLGRGEYFERLRSAACSAAPPVTVDVRCTCRYDDARVWMAAASHAKNLPFDHGTKVRVSQQNFFKYSQVSPYRTFPYDQNIPHKNFRSFEQYLKVPKVLGGFIFRR